MSLESSRGEAADAAGSSRAASTPSADLKVVGLAYAFAGAVAVVTGAWLGDAGPVARAFWADVAATLAIFGCSVLFRNSSFYDAYWSIAPIALLAWWWLQIGDAGAGLRQWLVGTGVVAWGARLTWNWARGWRGLHHEDWRYVDLQEKTGRAYWAVSFAGIHMGPTLFVFAGCLPLLPALRSSEPFGGLDVLAALVMGGAIAIEARADQELRRFRSASPAPGAFLRSGLWARSRHPNYFGEMSFWWGLFLFGVAAEPGAWWTGLGALSITALFFGVSLPMMEQRMRQRRPGYAAWAERVPLVIPWRATEEAADAHGS